MSQGSGRILDSSALVRICSGKNEKHLGGSEDVFLISVRHRLQTWQWELVLRGAHSSSICCLHEIISAEREVQQRLSMTQVHVLHVSRKGSWKETWEEISKECSAVFGKVDVKHFCTPFKAPQPWHLKEKHNILCGFLQNNQSWPHAA